MSYATYGQEAILGRLLMDIVHGDLTDETIHLVDQLDQNELGAPLDHIVSYVHGMNVDPDMRESINRDLLDELRIIAIEQTKVLWLEEEERPNWQLDAPIPGRAACILKDLLLETLQGRIGLETLIAIDEMGELENTPEPYGELLSYAQYANENGEEISRALLQILRVTIDQIIKMRS